MTDAKKRGRVCGVAKKWETRANVGKKKNESERETQGGRRKWERQ